LLGARRIAHELRTGVARHRQHRPDHGSHPTGAPHSAENGRQRPVSTHAPANAYRAPQIHCRSTMVERDDSLASIIRQRRPGYHGSDNRVKRLPWSMTHWSVKSPGDDRREHERSRNGETEPAVRWGRSPFPSVDDVSSSPSPCDTALNQETGRQARPGGCRPWPAGAAALAVPCRMAYRPAGRDTGGQRRQKEV